MKVLWFIPTSGDGPYLGSEKGRRELDTTYAQQIARAADTLGYYGVLIPTGRGCEDSWIVASSLASVTKRLRFLVALRPGLISPTAHARMAATLDRFSDGRLLVNVVAGGNPVELAGDGLHLSHAERYEATDEFLTVWRKLLAGEQVDYSGKYVRVEGGSQKFRPVQTPHPPLYFGGSSESGQKVAAKHVDVYLTWGEPPAQVAEKIASVRKLAEQEGRTVRFGIRLHVIVRETEKEAWQAAEDLIRYVDEESIERAQQIFSQFDSVGQKRMVNLHQGGREALEISPNLWAGIGLLRSGAGTALVGDPITVAKRMKEYAELGIETFVLSGYPHLEEAYRFAELVFPHLPLVVGDEVVAAR